MISSGSYTPSSALVYLSLSLSSSLIQIRAAQDTYNTSNLDSVHARHITIKSLPTRNPARGGVDEGDEALVDLARTFLNTVFVAGELEELFAVWAAFAAELGRGHDDAADHAGAEAAVLAWGDVVAHCFVEVLARCE